MVCRSGWPRPARGALLTIVSLACASQGLAQTSEEARPAPDPSAEPVRVFEEGERGYQSFRIPAIVRTQDGTLLAFAEGRLHGRADHGNIDVVLKRSSDGGRTWSALQVVADCGEGVFGNPTPVVVRESGDVVMLMSCEANGVPEADVRSGRRGSRDPWMVRSTDGGRTWTGLRALKDEAKRENWSWYASGPCHGIQLERGPHAGRLVMPINHAISGSGANTMLSAHLALSDDGGQTWHIGAVDDSHVGSNELNPNECTVAELADGRLYVNARDQHGSNPAVRAHAWSEDGGETFVAPFAAVNDLVGAVCQASVLAVDGGKRLVYSGPSVAGKRQRLTLRTSDDGGKSWAEWRVLFEGGAAYSDLVELDGGALGCLFEGDDYRWIGYLQVDPERDPSEEGALAAAAEGEWIPLFNGRDLTGWTPKIRGHKLGEDPYRTFRVEDGLLKVAYDQYDLFEGRFGHLFFDGTHSHYRFRVEYRFVGEQTAGGPGWAWRNSGVMIHGQAPETMARNQDFPVSIEVQLLGGADQGERPNANLCTPGTNVVMDGELIRRHCTNSTSKTYRGDDWVTVEIEVRGSQLIRHLIDGQSVLEYSAPQLDPNDKEAQLLLESQPPLLEGGSISLQGESHPLEFRRVEMMVLEK